MQAGVIEEFVIDAIDNALDSEGMEEEIDEEVDKVLTAIAGETAAELPEAVRKERIKVPTQKTKVHCMILRERTQSLILFYVFFSCRKRQLQKVLIMMRKNWKRFSSAC